MEMNFSTLLVKTDVTLKDVLAALDKNGKGVVFIVDHDQIMRGLLTDSDMRRAFLKGASISENADLYMNREFVSGTLPKEKAENISLLNDKISNLPILNSEGQVVDLLRLADFWRLPVMEPVLKGKEAEYVLDCLATNWISSQGKYVEQFQNKFMEFHKVNHALCVSNGTAALHLAMAALEIGRDDEVIIPDLTFAAPASMAVLCGAKPVFVDVDRTTWTMNPAAIEERITSRTKAIVPVHLYGHPCDMDPIMEIAKRHGLYVIEDCAEALGAEYKGQKVGTIGDIGTFSFFANKVITTGEGGMVTTNNHELRNKMQLLRDHGMTREKRYWHHVAGFNYRLTNLQAAIGLAQMEKIHEFLHYRKEIVARYDSQLKDIKGIYIPPRAKWAKNIFWLYSIIIDEKVTGIGRDTLMAHLADQGIDTRPFFYPLHQQPPFIDEFCRYFPNSEWLASAGLSLPTSNNIKLEDIDKVCASIFSVMKNINIFCSFDLKHIS
ncbi:MAG: aminotransferase class I/II-fold pyridoxal phosphate-dependent enzyme [Desulfuromonadaceae bacterium]